MKQQITKTAVNNEFFEQIGAKVRYYRNLRGLNQKELAEMLDISFQQVQKYENGKNRVALDTLMKMTEIFQVGLPGFFDTKDHPVMDARTGKMLNSFNKLPEGQKQVVFDLIVNLKKKGGIMSDTVAYSNETTSKDAAEYVALSVTGKRLEALNHITNCGVRGSTGSELCEATGMLLYTAKPRCTELSYAGYIKDSGMTRPNENGMQEIVWVSVENPEIRPIAVKKKPNKGLGIFDAVLKRNPHLKNTFTIHEINAIRADLTKV